MGHFAIGEPDFESVAWYIACRNAYGWVAFATTVVAVGKIREVFGKDSGIRQSDVQLKVVEAELDESVTIEYKTVGRATAADADLIEAVLISPLVAFLNKQEHTSSLLVLGVLSKKHIPTDIEPIPESVFSPERIESLIASGLASVPPFRNPPTHRVVVVKCGSKGNVLLIELDRWDEGGYFSTGTNLSYVRRGDESVTLSIPEFFALADRARSSNTSLDIEEVHVGADPASGATVYTLDLVVENHGTNPGLNVTGFLEISVRKGDDVDVEVPNSFLDVTHLNKGKFRMYSFRFDHAAIGPAYPTTRTDMGQVKVTSKTPIVFEVTSSTNDSSGHTDRSYRVTPKGRLRTTEYKRRPWG